MSCSDILSPLNFDVINEILIRSGYVGHLMFSYTCKHAARYTPKSCPISQLMLEIVKSDSISIYEYYDYDHGLSNSFWRNALYNAIIQAYIGRYCSGETIDWLLARQTGVMYGIIVSTILDFAIPDRSIDIIHNLYSKGQSILIDQLRCSIAVRNSKPGLEKLCLLRHLGESSYYLSTEQHTSEKREELTEPNALWKVRHLGLILPDGDYLDNYLIDEALRFGYIRETAEYLKSITRLNDGITEYRYILRFCHANGLSEIAERIIALAE